MNILCIDTSAWVGAERLPIMLMEAGFNLGCLCSKKSVLNIIKGVSRVHWQEGAGFVEQLETEINRFRPDMLLCLDDQGMIYINSAVSDTENGFAERQRRLLEMSFGCLDTLQARCLRSSLAGMANDIRLPKMMLSMNKQQLLVFGAAVGWRAVFKKEFSCDGAGVRSVKTESEYRAALQRLLGYDNGFIVQELVDGAVTMRSSIALQGSELCGISFGKTVSAHGGLGHSTVITPLLNDEMRESAGHIARIFGITGPFSCDFILERKTGAAYLIELNPRPTTVFHLGHLFGVDMATAFKDILVGSAHLQQDKPREEQTIALFPKELFRDPKSQWLQSAYHDLPHEYPEVVKFYVAMLQKVEAKAEVK